MDKFFGKIGFATTTELSPGVWGDSIVEHEYSGDIIKNVRRYETSDKLNDNLNISNEISIVADLFAYENSHSMKYVEYLGAKWRVSSIDVQYPRLILSLGGVYSEQANSST